LDEKKSIWRNLASPMKNKTPTVVGVFVCETGIKQKKLLNSVCQPVSQHKYWYFLEPYQYKNVKSRKFFLETLFPKCNFLVLIQFFFASREINQFWEIIFRKNLLLFSLNKFVKHTILQVINRSNELRVITILL